MKLENFEKFCETASKGVTQFDYVLFFLSLLLMAVFKDLNLDMAFRVSGSIFLCLLMWYFCTFICLLVLACIKKHRSKKTNIEKLIDEELKKGEK